MMEVIIQNIKIYDDGVVTIDVMCNNCKSINQHNIGHACMIDENGTKTIDFSKLGKRVCHNFENQNHCCMNYKLY